MRTNLSFREVIKKFRLRAPSPGDNQHHRRGGHNDSDRLENVLSHLPFESETIVSSSKAPGAMW
jgi:hypothetical protein